MMILLNLRTQTNWVSSLITRLKKGHYQLKANTYRGVYTSPEGKLHRVWIDVDDEDETSFHFVVYSDSWSDELCEYVVRYTLEISGLQHSFSYSHSPDVGIHWDSGLHQFTGYSS